MKTSLMDVIAALENLGLVEKVPATLEDVMSLLQEQQRQFTEQQRESNAKTTQQQREITELRAELAKCVTREREEAHVAKKRVKSGKTAVRNRSEDDDGVIIID
jgi:dsDNA-specific endonuclease/ATPase MutS2